jgi:predicted PurR-regulated permease PerM
MAKRRPNSASSTGSSEATSGSTGSASASPSPIDASIAPTTLRDLELIHLWQIQAVRDLLLIAAVIFIFWTGYVLRAVTVPLLVALMLAYLFEPVVRKISRHPKIRRPFAVGMIIGIGAVGLTAVAALLIPVVVVQTANFADDISTGRLATRFAQIESIVPERWRDDYRDFIGVMPGGEAAMVLRDERMKPAESTDETSGETPSDASTEWPFKDGSEPATGPDGAADGSGDSSNFVPLERQDEAEPTEEGAAGGSGGSGGSGDAGDDTGGAAGMLSDLIGEIVSPESDSEEELSEAAASANEELRGATAGEVEAIFERLFDKHRIELEKQMREERAIELGFKSAPPPDRESRVFALARGGLEAAWTALMMILEVGFLVVLIPFYFFFFSLWYPHVVRFVRNLIPETKRERTLDLLGKMDLAVAGFVRGRIVISIIMGAMLAIGWLIVGVPYSIILGIVTGLFCAVPYLGLVGVPVAVLLLLLEQYGLKTDERMALWAILIWPVAVFVIVQLIEGYVLIPAIAGKATNLDPVTILVAVLAGASVMGIYGMLLAIPLAACAKILIMEIVMPKVRDWAAGREKDPLPINRS